MLDGIGEEIQQTIEEDGRTVQIQTIVRTGGTDMNPVFGDPTDVDAIAVIFKFKAAQNDNTLVQANDKRAYISASAKVTKQNKIVDGDNTYQIVELDTVAPGDDIFLYDAHLRV